MIDDSLFDCRVPTKEIRGGGVHYCYVNQQRTGAYGQRVFLQGMLVSQADNNAMVVCGLGGWGG